MYLEKKVKLINHDCLPILMLLYIMPYIMLFADLSNAVCLYNAYFLPFNFANAFRFHALSCFINTVCQCKIFCIIHSAFNLLALLIPCSHRFLMKGLCVLWRNST